MATPVSVYMRSVRSIGNIAVGMKPALKPALKPSLQIGSDVSENELRTVGLRISMTAAAIAAVALKYCQS